MPNQSRVESILVAILELEALRLKVEYGLTCVDATMVDGIVNKAKEALKETK